MKPPAPSSSDLGLSVASGVLGPQTRKQQENGTWIPMPGSWDNSLQDSTLHLYCVLYLKEFFPNNHPKDHPKPPTEPSEFQKPHAQGYGAEPEPKPSS